ncbi:cytochrome P450 6k1 [Anabrus simplex]|uniref:cytochrome P450 6k1 n=1 Tax=Anabrus simplex TaxID=316456 RepID=UPI0035A28F1D
MFIIVSLLVFINIVLLFLYSIWTYNYWMKKGVPYSHFTWGNFLDMILLRRSVADLISDLYRTGYGFPLLGYFEFCTPALLIRDPKLVKKVLVTDFHCFEETGYGMDVKLDPLLARNPFALCGKLWRAVRSLLTPGFTLYKVKNQFPLMAVECREMIHYLETEAPKYRPGGVEVKSLLRKFSVDVVVRCAFGVHGNSFSDPEAVFFKIGESFNEHGSWKQIRLILYNSLPKILRSSFWDINAQYFFLQLIKEIILYRERNRVFRNDYLHMLMHIKRMGTIVKGRNIIRVGDVDIEYTDENIASYALLLFFTGFHLPTCTLSFALYELASNPEVQTRLREEIDDVLMQHNGGLTYEAVEEMIYLDMVLKVTLRKYPPFHSITRMCTKPYHLTLDSGRTILVEKGTAVVIPVEALQNDPNHFPEPDLFDPGRFSEEQRVNVKPFTYLPYGAGPRQCFGMKFADAEMKAGLVAIVSHFEIHRTEMTPATIEKDPCTITLDMKDSLWLDFVRRK